MKYLNHELFTCQYNAAVFDTYSHIVKMISVWNDSQMARSHTDK